MSISNRHTILPFVAGTSVAFAEQRLAKVGYKSTKNKPARFPSVCVSLPVITELSEQDIENLAPHIITLIQNAQDGIIRSLYESNDGLLKEIADAEISVNACVAYLDAEATGGRLTKEGIIEWFDSSELGDNLTVLISEKLGYADPSPAQLVQVNKHIEGYKQVLASLAGGKTFLQPAQIKGCKVALSTLQPEDDMCKKLMNRLVQMEVVKPIAELLEL